ncbi:MAG: DNA oxidative demethylase AlkB [Kofleriaceae bacterium]
MTLDLFHAVADGSAAEVELAPGARLLRRFAAPLAPDAAATLASIVATAPLRHMRTPGGRALSAAMTNCGRLGWISDARGYRYEPTDPLTGLPWPALPTPWLDLAHAAAACAGFPGFTPDACLINRYAPGAGMTLHQDRNERDLSAPVVSISLGLPAVFLLGGILRGDRAQRIRVAHGDVVVWGGPARLRFHGVAPIAAGDHAAVGPWRYNLTLRAAG